MLKFKLGSYSGLPGGLGKKRVALWRVGAGDRRGRAGRAATSMSAFERRLGDVWRRRSSSSSSLGSRCGGVLLAFSLPSPGAQR